MEHQAPNHVCLGPPNKALNRTVPFASGLLGGSTWMQGSPISTLFDLSVRRGSGGWSLAA